ncbi:MAG TPA: response regulator transcription factor [Clostridiaceae bacterium]
MKRNILIIEDEDKVSEVIKAYLQKEGFDVVTASSGLEGIGLFKKNNFQLVILDLMLPDIDGEEVCRILRNMSDVYIFMLTAKVALEDKIEGLNLGADEYLTKPLSPRELTARVNALFRRIGTKEENLIFIDSYLSVDNEARVARVSGKEISLTPNEFDILIALIRNRGRVLSREQLIDIVFGIDFEGSDRTVDVHIKNIRKKIEQDTKNPLYIVTVTKSGYKFGGDDICSA